MSKTNGKTRTHFEQIPVALVERIAIADGPESYDGDKRLSDIPEEARRPYQVRRTVDRRKSCAVALSPYAKES